MCTNHLYLPLLHTDFIETSKIPFKMKGNFCQQLIQPMSTKSTYKACTRTAAPLRKTHPNDYSRGTQNYKTHKN